MNPGAKHETILLIFLALLVINTLIGAFILRAAVSLYNKLTSTPRSPAPVTEPSLGQAAFIVFTATFLNIIFGLILGTLMRGPAVATQRGGEAAPVAVPAAIQATCILFSFLVLAGLLTAILPTTFLRGLLVSLCYLLVTLFLFYGVYLVSMTVIGK